jgi:hypothetical protein
VYISRAGCTARSHRKILPAVVELTRSPGLACESVFAPCGASAVDLACDHTGRSLARWQCVEPSSACLQRWACVAQCERSGFDAIPVRVGAAPLVEQLWPANAARAVEHGFVRGVGRDAGHRGFVLLGHGVRSVGVVRSVRIGCDQAKGHFVHGRHSRQRTKRTLRIAQ